MGLTFSTNIKLYQMKNKNMKAYLCASIILGGIQGFMQAPTTTFGDFAVTFIFTIVFWGLMLLPMLNAE
jgi:hypothetical protein